MDNFRARSLRFRFLHKFESESVLKQSFHTSPDLLCTLCIEHVNSHFVCDISLSKEGRAKTSIGEHRPAHPGGNAVEPRLTWTLGPT